MSQLEHDNPRTVSAGWLAGSWLAPRKVGVLLFQRLWHLMCYLMYCCEAYVKMNRMTATSQDQ